MRAPRVGLAVVMSVLFMCGCGSCDDGGPSSGNNAAPTGESSRLSGDGGFIKHMGKRTHDAGPGDAGRD